MIQQLRPKGVKVPTGFATTAYAYRYFISAAGLENKLREIFADLDVEDVNNLRRCGKKARSLMLQTPFPIELQEAIAQAYQSLCQQYEADTDVAVRSSATAEDLPDASFAGQQETYLNVHGLEAVLQACHKCFASIFTDRAISYRQIKGFDHFSIALSVGVQKWYVLTWPVQVLCSPLTRKQVLEMLPSLMLLTVWVKTSFKEQLTQMNI